MGKQSKRKEKAEEMRQEVQQEPEHLSTLREDRRKPWNDYMEAFLQAAKPVLENPEIKLRLLGVARGAIDSSAIPPITAFIRKLSPDLDWMFGPNLEEWVASTIQRMSSKLSSESELLLPEIIAPEEHIYRLLPHNRVVIGPKETIKGEEGCWVWVPKSADAHDAMNVVGFLHSTEPEHRPGRPLGSKDTQPRVRSNSEKPLDEEHDHLERARIAHEVSSWNKIHPILQARLLFPDGPDEKARDQFDKLLEYWEEHQRKSKAQ
jgi:hypothetical protein